MADAFLDSDPTLLPYLAGFFDGEGSVNVLAHRGHLDGRRYHRIQLSVAQVDPAPLHLFAQRFGGGIHPRAAANERCRPSWRWQAQAGRAHDVLEALLPFLIVKREAALLALSLRDYAYQRGATERREAVRLAVIAANRRGYEPEEVMPDG